MNRDLRRTGLGFTSFDVGLNFLLSLRLINLPASSNSRVAQELPSASNNPPLVSEQLA